VNKDKLREKGVYNPYELAGHGNVYIFYSPNEYGRGGRGARWVVDRPGFKVETNAFWRDNGRKTFPVFGAAGTSHKEQKDNALKIAKEWAGAKYGITEWAKTPFGSWMDANVLKARLEEIGA
jgi:hypothetical protein